MACCMNPWTWHEHWPTVWAPYIYLSVIVAGATRNAKLTGWEEFDLENGFHEVDKKLHIILNLGNPAVAIAC